MPEKFIKSGDYLISISAKDKNGSDMEILEKYIFSELYIQEAVNYVPYFELYLVGDNFNDLYNVWDMRITFAHADNSIKYTDIPLGVMSRSVFRNIIQIKGWMVKSEDFRVPHTCFLGKSVREALVNLDIRPESSILISPNSDVKDQNILAADVDTNVFQINTTNLQQALSLCQQVAATPYWCIGRWGINVGKYIESMNNSDILASLGPMSFSSATRTIPDSESSDVRKRQESPGGWFSSVWNNGCIENHFLEDHTAHKNAITNIKAGAIGPRIVAEKTFDSDPGVVVGTQYPNENKDVFPDVENWVLASATYHYSMNNFVCHLQYYGVTNAIEQQKFVDGDTYQ